MVMSFPFFKNLLWVHIAYIILLLLSIAFKDFHKSLDLLCLSSSFPNQSLPDYMSTTGMTNPYFASKPTSNATFSNFLNRNLSLWLSHSTLMMCYTWFSLYNAVYHIYKYIGQSLLLENNQIKDRIIMTYA